LVTVWVGFIASVVLFGVFAASSRNANSGSSAAGSFLSFPKEEVVLKAHLDVLLGAAVAFRGAHRVMPLSADFDLLTAAL
jgi:hypothetical protein